MYDSEDSGLLPVLDPLFNMREICKQCVLLEDHLSHPEKRCRDCCIKHFLTLEALAEEAITIDKDQKLYPKIKDLPQVIRGIEKKWISDPDNNALPSSQELRKIRKQFQEDSFDLSKCKNCTACSI
jgi:hypothetical protein